MSSFNASVAYFCTRNSLLQDKLMDTLQRKQFARDNLDKLSKSRDELRPVAVHASVLYSLLSTMSAANHMYQISLQQFLQIVQISLQRLFAPVC